MKQILRVSDKRNPIVFEGITRNDCIKNFAKVFGVEDTIVVADNCTPETIDFLRELNFTYRSFSDGKIGSFLNILKIATSELPEDEIVYLCDDDFVHVWGSKDVLQQGINEGLTRTGYVSLFDSLDKYFKEGPNPYITSNYEIVKLLITKLTHWKAATSSKFVVATKVKTLKEDLDIITKHVKGDTFDYVEASVDIIISKDREFLVAIPGLATECCKLASPFINWKLVIEEN